MNFLSELNKMLSLRKKQLPLAIITEELSYYATSDKFKELKNTESALINHIDQYFKWTDDVYKQKPEMRIVYVTYILHLFRLYQSLDYEKSHPCVNSNEKRETLYFKCCKVRCCKNCIIIFLLNEQIIHVGCHKNALFSIDDFKKQ